MILGIIITFGGVHAVCSVILLRLRFVRVSTSQMDLRGHLSDGKTQFLPTTDFHWLVGVGAN